MDHLAFWAALDELVATSTVRIDRPKGTAHPRYPSFIYPLDYGYLEGTQAADGGGIDVWVGSLPYTIWYDGKHGRNQTHHHG